MVDAELIDLIKKHLPEQVGDALRGELSELKRLRASTAALEERVAALKSEQEGTLALNATLVSENQALRAAAADVRSRESGVKEREIKQDLLALELKLCNSHKQEYLALVRTVFASPVFERRVEGTVPVAVQGQQASQYNQGTSGYVSHAPVQTTETTTRKV